MVARLKRFLFNNKHEKGQDESRRAYHATSTDRMAAYCEDYMQRIEDDERTLDACMEKIRRGEGDADKLMQDYSNHMAQRDMEMDYNAMAYAWQEVGDCMRYTLASMAERDLAREGLTPKQRATLETIRQQCQDVDKETQNRHGKAA